MEPKRRRLSAKQPPPPDVIQSQVKSMCDAQFVRVSILIGVGGCSLSQEFASSTSLAELKNFITEQTGIEYNEQRLFVQSLLPANTEQLGALAVDGVLCLTLLCTPAPEVLQIFETLREHEQGEHRFHQACLDVAQRFAAVGMSDLVVERRRNVAVQFDYHKVIINALVRFDRNNWNKNLTSPELYLCAALAHICTAVPGDECENAAEARREAVADAGAIAILVASIEQENAIFVKEQACRALCQVCRAGKRLGKKGRLAAELRRQHCVDFGALRALDVLLKTPVTTPVRSVALSALQIMVAKVFE